MLSERSPRATFRSAPHRTMWRSAWRHVRDVSNIRLVASAVNGDRNLDHRVFADSGGAQAGSTPAGRAERAVGAQRRALTPRAPLHNLMRDGRRICGRPGGEM